MTDVSGIQVATKDLLAAMKLAGACVERRNTVPVLDQLRCHANGALTLSGTDLDMLCEVRVPYEGAACAPFLSGDWRRLAAAIGHAGGGAVTLTPPQAADVPDALPAPLAVAAGGASLSVNQTAHVDDWPVLHEIADERWRATLGARELSISEALSGARPQPVKAIL